MKRKNLVGLALVCIVVASVFALTTRFIDAQTAPVLSIVPTGASGASGTTIISSQAVGTTFSVDVRLDNYASVNVGGANNGVSEISYLVHWDPAVLTETNLVHNSWLPDQSKMGTLPVDNTNGYQTVGQICFGSDSQETADSSTGSVSTTLTFKVLSAGTTALTLAPSDVGVPYLSAPSTVDNKNHDVTGTITFDAQYGLSTSPTPITSIPPSPTPTPGSVYSPTAVVSTQNGTVFQTGSQIVLDGSSSTPGSDNQICPITNYAWLVQYPDGSRFNAASGSIVSIVVNTTTSLRVNLIVTAKDVNTSPSPQYVNTSATSIWINVELPQQMTKLDVFTNKGGTGPNTSSGPFGPQELVRLFAYVSFNGDSSTQRKRCIHRD